MVIAIIGILSSVVLVSLGVARSRAADAKVKVQITGAKNSAEIFYETNKSYNGSTGFVSWDCTTPNSMFQDTESGMIQYTDPANYPAGTTIRCSSTDTEYAISASLQATGEFWCVDSGGAAGIVTAADGLHTTAHQDDDTTCNI